MFDVHYKVKLMRLRWQWYPYWEHSCSQWDYSAYNYYHSDDISGQLQVPSPRTAVCCFVHAR